MQPRQPFARPIDARRGDSELIEFTAVELNVRAAARELYSAASGRELRQIIARHGEARDLQRAGGTWPVDGVLTRRIPLRHQIEDAFDDASFTDIVEKRGRLGF